MQLRSVTADEAHEDMSWLKAEALLNIPNTSVTAAATFHAEMVKAEAP